MKNSGMSDKSLVINTSPLLALIAATGDLRLLRDLFERVVVPAEVANEIEQGGLSGFGVEVFQKAAWLDKQSQPTHPTILLNELLDLGEAAVVQTAVDLRIKTVAIDERSGRRIARLHGLQVIGTLGILLKAYHAHKVESLEQAIENMKRRGIWISQRLENM